MREPYYQDENVTLYHGDCREITEWLTADVLVTDPPYGIAYTAGTMPGGRRSGTTNSTIEADGNPVLRDAVLQMWGARPALVFGSWRVPRPPGTANRLVWHKVNTWAAARRLPWFSVEEEIYQLGSGFGGDPEPNVIATDEMRSGAYGQAARLGHPTPKPIVLMERLVAKCPPGAVADPFVGSGSTLVAARNLSRRAIGVEIEERYCEIAARRLSQGVLEVQP
jgi:site-specific DNA-methyltransferase (adenine-specific)